MSKRFCLHCGAELGPEERFCDQCGRPAPLPSPGPAPLPPPQVVMTMVTPPLKVAPRTAPQPSEPDPPEPPHSPKSLPGRSYWIIAVIALSAMAGGFVTRWYYLRTPPPVPSRTDPPAVEQPATAQAPPAPKDRAKPSPLDPVSVAPEKRPRPPNDEPYIAPAPQAASSPATPTEGRPVYDPGPSVQTRPADSRPASGTLSYSGPPVAPDGEVVFDGLPQGEIKFSYDSNIWAARLMRDAHSSRLILRNKSPLVQIKCVVRWDLGA
ncbi:MAG TPA: zinc-ribbon domain-containing protein [Bryobacteraceae bacterium]|nr:zinc-ribbon domain-containing protein [Bryobacteraceae bacterium]